MKKRMDLHAAENRVIYLGRRGENLANTIEIDASPMRKEFPECTFLLMVQRPGESSAYSAAIAMDGDVVSWPLTNADTGIAGDGCAEMRAMVGDTIAKTALFRTHIDESMNLPQEETPPAPQKGWLDQALAAQVKAEEAAQSAKHSADTAEATVNAVIDKATAATSSATQAAASANSAAQTAQTVADTVQAKLDNGDFVGAKGDKGDPGNVRDVRVAGVSMLKDGVANVPIATADAPGVVSIVSPQDSGIWNDKGNLKISFATDTEISGRSGTRKAIVCANLDNAVKAAMCDGKGAAWTSDEQKAARERMRIPGGYELIEEITIAEGNVSVITRDVDRLCSAKLAIICPPMESIITANALIFFGDASKPEYIYLFGEIAPTKVGVYRHITLEAELRNNYWRVYKTAENDTGSMYPNGSWTTSIVETAPSRLMQLPSSNLDAITKITLNAYPTDAYIPVGTKIMIYGVRA